MSSKKLDVLSEETIVGGVLKERYIIGRFLDQGSNGVVHKIVDKDHPQAQLVIKFASDATSFGSEVSCMKRIAKHSFGRFNTPQVVSYGMAVRGEDNLLAWVIMPRYGSNLETYFEKMQHKMSKETILDVGLAMITTLESTHKAGYVFNDLKLDNLMVGYGNRPSKTVTEQSAFKECTIHLVDFGYATKYKDKKGSHIV